MTTLERRALHRELAAQGFVFQITKWPAKATYYNRDGEAMPNLPADPGSMGRYMERGFTLVKPVFQQAPTTAASVAVVDSITPTPVAVVERSPLECTCGFVARNPTGLAVHQRRHAKEKS